MNSPETSLERAPGTGPSGLALAVEVLRADLRPCETDSGHHWTPRRPGLLARQQAGPWPPVVGRSWLYP